MSWVRQFLLAGAAVGALSGASMAPASATTLTPGSGWVSDSIFNASDPSLNSPLTFTINKPAYLSVVDCCIVGDVYQIQNSSNQAVLGTTSFVTLPYLWHNTGSFFDLEWAGSTYSKISLLFGPGSYSLNVLDIAANFGIPAGFGERLDYAAAPEPLSIALLGAGLVGLGVVGRRKRA